MTQAPVSHPAGRSSIRWVILALLFLASFVAYVLRTNMSVAGETMMKDLGLLPDPAGFVLAAFAWGYAIFQFPGGVFGDRIGGRRALTIIAIAWGVLNILTGLVPGPRRLGVTGHPRIPDRAAFPHGCGSGAALPGDRWRDHLQLVPGLRLGASRTGSPTPD